jgi:nitrate reductase gamma subunit
MSVGYVLFGLAYICFAIFIIGTIWRIVDWARSAVPLKIPTTAGQQPTFKFITRTWIDKIDSPSNKKWTFVRMLFEVFLFRSLFRNTRYYIEKGGKNVDTRWLWLFAMIFHYSLLVIVIRHLRFFTNPVPDFVRIIEQIDGFVGIPIVPPLLMTGLTALIGLAFLWGRRILLAKERCISLPSDHLILFFMAVILISGLLLRYIVKADLTYVKMFALSLMSFTPPPPEVAENLPVLFIIHFTFVCITIAYIPFSKVIHFAGIWFSPTRNMPNDNRMRRHVNPWDPNPELPILVREGITVAGVTYKCKKLDWNTYYEMYKDQLDEITDKNYTLKPEL